jgi:hypothetical protein
MKRLVLLFASACAMFSTEPYTATRDMRLYVTIDATTSATTTHVTADLTAMFGSVELGPNDALGMLVDGVPIVSARVTSFDLDVGAASGDFGFTVHHEGDHDAAVDVTLVPHSNIQATSSAGKLLLDWTAFPNAGDTTITVTGTCIHAQTIHVRTDTGHYELASAQLQELPVACAISLGLARSLQTEVPFMGDTFMVATVNQAESAEGQWTP